jgi:hypothetical protein
MCIQNSNAQSGGRICDTPEHISLPLTAPNSQVLCLTANLVRMTVATTYVLTMMTTVSLDGSRRKKTWTQQSQWARQFK